jgi:hypothetical protein
MLHGCAMQQLMRKGGSPSVLGDISNQIASRANRPLNRVQPRSGGSLGAVEDTRRGRVVISGSTSPELGEPARQATHVVDIGPDAEMDRRQSDPVVDRLYGKLHKAIWSVH